MSLRHFTKHLRGSAPIFPHMDELEIDSSYPCIIELVSLTISLPSLTGARRNTEEVQFGLGLSPWSRGSSSRAHRRHVATVEGATPPSSRPHAMPRISLLLLCSPLKRPSSQQRPENAGRSSHRARRAPPKHAQAVPHLELTPRLPAPLFLLPATPAAPPHPAPPLR